MMKCLTAASLIAIMAVGGVVAAQPPGRDGEQRGPGPGAALLRLFDVDNNGTLAEAELAGAGARLKRFDRNGDGQLDANELRDAMPFQGPPGSFGPGRPPRDAGPGRPGSSPSAPGGVVFESQPLANDDAERQILATLEAMRQGPRFANVSTSDGRLLRLLAESVGAKKIVEIGTSTGESGVWFALALRKTGGHLFTHELDAARADIAQANFERAGVAAQITIIRGDAHETVKQHNDPIDIVFLDADKEGYIDYLNKLLPQVRPGGLIIAHNMNPRQADPAYLKAITTNAALETSFLLMEGTGIGVTMKKR